jgi:hypothetical protein
MTKSPVLCGLVEHLAVADDRIQRRSKLMAHAGEEGRFVLARHLELPVEIAELLRGAVHVGGERAELVAIADRGRKKITKREAIVTQLVNKSAAADLKATQIVLAMLRDLECQADDPGEATVFAEADQEIIRRIQARLRNEKG